MEKLIVIGAGGHCKSVVDSLDREQYELCGFVDNYKVGSHLGKPILGAKIEEIPNYWDYRYFVAIGDARIRQMWYNRVQELELQLINIVDPTALVSPTAQMGVGNFVGKFAVINADSRIGDNNIINTKGLVEHECVVGNHTHISTNASVNGNVIVEDGVFVGSGSTIIGQKRLGSFSVIGAGATVITDVTPETTVVGVPARPIKRG